MEPAPLAVTRDAVNPKRFVAEKAPGVVRIFFVGQSTTEGWPFFPRGGYPEWLGAYVRDLLPGKRIEVINAGACASDSVRDLAIVKEVLQYNPDMLVLYEGNNERSYPIFRFVGGRLGRLLVGILGTRGLGGIETRNGLLGPYLDYRMLKAYEENVGEMLALARKQDVRVVLLAQVNKSVMIDATKKHPQNVFLARQESADVAFVDIPAVFFGKIKKGQPFMPRLLLDPIHPSLYGQQLFALAICRELAKRGWIAPAPQWRWVNLRSEKRYREVLALSPAFLARAYCVAFWDTVGRFPARAIVEMLREAERLRPGITREFLKEQEIRSAPPAAAFARFLAENSGAISARILAGGGRMRR